MDQRPRPDAPASAAYEAPRGRPPTGESREQLLRVLRRNRALLDGTATAGRRGEEETGVGHTVCSDPSSGVTRGDYSND